MDQIQVLELFDQMIKNPSLLENGEEYLKSYFLKNENFALHTTLCIMDKKIDQITRKHIGYLFKNILINNWENCPNKMQVQQLLLLGLIQNRDEKQTIELINVICSSLIQRGDIQEWYPLLVECFTQLDNNDYSIRSTFLQFFIHVFSKKDSSLSILSDQLLQKCYTLIIQTEVTHKSNNQVYEGRIQIIKLVYLTIETFTYADSSDIQLVNHCLDSTFKKWLDLCITVLQAPIKEHLKIRIYFLKILLCFIKDLPNYTKGLHSQIFQSVKPFFLQLSKLYCLSRILRYNFDNIDQQLKIQSQSDKYSYKNEDFLIDYNDDLLDYSQIPDALVEIQLFYTLQLFLNVPKSFLTDTDVNNSLFLCLFINEYQASEFPSNPEILTDELEDEPTVRTTALLIFESLFCSKKYKKITYNNLITFWKQNDELHLSWQGWEAKYLIYETFFEDIHTITNDVNQILIQNLLVQNEGIINNIVSGRKLNIYIKALQTNYNYNLDPLLVNLILNQIIIYIEKADSIGAGLIGFKNLASCIIYMSKNDCFSPQNQSQIENINLPLTIDNLFKNIDAVNLHILLDSTFHLLKIFKGRLNLDELVVSQIVKWASIYDNDTMICKIINDLIDYFSVYQNGWEVLFTHIQQFNGTLWLYIMRSLVQNSQDIQQKTKIGQKLQELILWITTPKNFDSDLMPQATILLKNFVMKFPEDIKISGFKDQILFINFKLLQTYQDDVTEQATSQCASLIFASWHHILEKGFNFQLLELISNKIVHQNVPSNIEGLFIVFSLMIQTHQEQGQNFLQSMNLDLFNQVFNKLVRFHSLFSQGNQINILSQIITQILMSGNQGWNSLFYNDPILQTKTQNLSIKLIEVLIDFFEKKQQFCSIVNKLLMKQKDIVNYKQNNGNDDEDDNDDDDEEWEDDDLERDQEIEYMSQEINKNYKSLLQLTTQVLVKRNMNKQVISRFFKEIIQQSDCFIKNQFKGLNRVNYDKLHNKILAV